ncbi:ATP-binding cassette domain-containing protein [Nonomuraea sp. LPB2021202275-12-8]|uniref:ATP-binding cassette domain-containing protein n=1 Tax=Nonomuraea sp. LPB2021202275-12-8 TaxID=3120159 RepID=UPI00300D836C
MIRQLVGVTGQYASVDENLTARENLWLFSRLQGIAAPRARRIAAELLDQFGLEEAADRPIAQFSGGMRRRLDLAASLITRPPLIFLDEPTTGLDPRTRGCARDRRPRAHPASERRRAGRVRGTHPQLTDEPRVRMVRK